MSPRWMRVLLALALAGTLTAAWFAPDEDGDGVALSEHARTAGEARTAPPASAPAVIGRRDKTAAVDVLEIRRRDDEGDEGAALFAPIAWTRPAGPAAEPRPEPEPVAEPLPAPVAPPPPFLVLGRYEDAGRSIVFLQHMDDSLAVAVGDTIAESYRVEKLEGSTLTLRYLPLDELQTLDVGGIQ